MSPPPCLPPYCNLVQTPCTSQHTVRTRDQVILGAFVVALSLVQLLRDRTNIRLVVVQDVNKDRLLPNVGRDLVERTHEDPQEAHQIQTLQERRVRVDAGLVVHRDVARIEVGLELAEARGPLVGEGDVGPAGLDVEMLVPRMLPRHDRVSLVREVGLDRVRCDVELDRRLDACGCAQNRFAISTEVKSSRREPDNSF